jgi:hypothetical protein
MLKRIAFAVAVVSLAVGALRVTVLTGIGFGFAVSLPLLLATIALNIASLVRTLGPRIRPARLEPWPRAGGPPVFRAPRDDDQILVSTAINWALFGAIAPNLVRSDYSLGIIGAVLVAAWLTLLTPVTIVTIVSRPSLTIGRDGVNLRFALGGWVAPWEAIAPHPPRPPHARVPGAFDGNLHQPLSRGELVRAWGLGRLLRRRTRLTVPRHLFDVHPWFLQDVLSYYAEHPEHRPGIGTDAEHASLLVALGATAPAAPAQG